MRLMFVVCCAEAPVCVTRTLEKAHEEAEARTFVKRKKGVPRPIRWADNYTLVERGSRWPLAIIHEVPLRT